MNIKQNHVVISNVKESLNEISTLKWNIKDTKYDLIEIYEFSLFILSHKYQYIVNNEFLEYFRNIIILICFIYGGYNTWTYFIFLNISWCIEEL